MVVIKKNIQIEKEKEKKKKRKNKKPKMDVQNVKAQTQNQIKGLLFVFFFVPSPLLLLLFAEVAQFSSFTKYTDQTKTRTKQKHNKKTRTNPRNFTHRLRERERDSARLSWLTFLREGRVEFRVNLFWGKKIRVFKTLGERKLFVCARERD